MDILPSHKIEVVSARRNLLGESPVWLAARQSFFWLDILGKKLFEKRLNSANRKYDHKWSFSFTPTSIIPDKKSNCHLWLITNVGIVRFNLNIGKCELVQQLSLSENQRTNDGFVSPDGNIFFGTMEWSPTGRNGNIFCYTKMGALIDLGISTGIPNTFVWLNKNEVAISDSLVKKILKYNSDGTTLISPKMLKSFSDTGGEPDGGALDTSGTLWLALWGRGKVIGIDATDGTINYEIPLPVVQPSSCCFGGPNMKQLFITSSSVGIRGNRNSQDGKNYIIPMKTSGVALKGFELRK